MKIVGLCVGFCNIKSERVNKIFSQKIKRKLDVRREMMKEKESLCHSTQTTSWFRKLDVKGSQT